MNRRLLLVLALGLSMVSAGCVDPEAVALFNEVNTTEVAERTTINTDALNRAAAEAAENGTSTPTTRELPYDVQQDREAVVHQGVVYDMNQQRVGEVQGTSIGIRANTTDKSATVPFSALSEDDKRIVRPVVQSADSDNPIVAGEFYTDAELNNSVFKDRSSFRVAVDGEVYQITVVDRRQESQERYTYTATQVAPTTTAYGEQLIEQHAFTLEQAPNGTESLIDKAIEEGYYGQETDSFTTLRERFQQEDAIREYEHRGNWLVYYEGELYWAELSW